MDEHTKVIALMAVALTDARAQIQADRNSLHASVVQAGGEVGEEDRPGLDEYERVLNQIDIAISAATGGLA